METTATRVKKEIASFCELADAVTARPISDELHGFIDRLKYWIRGYLDWVVHDTLRYADQFIESDADDGRFSAPGLSLLNKSCSSVTESTSSLV